MIMRLLFNRIFCFIFGASIFVESGNRGIHVRREPQETDTEGEEAPAKAPEADAKACACIDALLEKGARLIAPGQKNAKRAKRVAQNRLMLALLGGSVASLASGTYRVHAALGWSFVGLLALHLYQHRRVL